MSKKIISLFLVLVMLMGLAVPAMAAEEHDISTGKLAITNDGSYTVTGSTTENYITVAAGVTATITLKDVSITLSDGTGVSGGNATDMSGAGTAAIALGAGSDVTIVLEGSSTLQSGAGRAAIEVPGSKIHVDGNPTEATPASLTIQGSGSLSATGGNSAAGIGGSFCMNAGNITINSGDITATAGGGSGGDSGAGIGGGHAGDKVDKAYGSFDSITINGGVIKADGVRLGAGIGAGAHGKCDGAVINITGGIVTANGGNFWSDPGDDIGLAHGGGGNVPPTVTISSNAVVIADSINEKNSYYTSSKTNFNGGIVIDGSTATMYGDVTLTDSFTLEAGKELKIPDGMTLTVPADVVLTVKGSITGSGTLKLAGGELIDENRGVEVTIDQGPYYIDLTVAFDSPTYGTSVTLTATAKKKAEEGGTDSVYTSADSAVLFTIGDKVLGSVNFVDGVASTEFTVDLPAGGYAAKASATIDGIMYSARIDITVNKADQSAPGTAPSAAENGVSYGSIDLMSITDEGYGDVQYAYVEKPAEGDAASPSNWQTSTKLNGLKAGTTYIVYARFAGNDCYNPSPASNGTEISTASMNTMDAPVLPSSENHTVTYKSVTLAAPNASEVYREATVEYRMSSDNIDWGEWQSSAEFTGLSEQTTYYFQARYAITAYGHYSAASDALELTTPETPTYNVSIRVIGASQPSGNPSFSQTSYDYKGAEYQNWLKTKSHSIKAGTTAYDLIDKALKEAGFTYTLNKTYSGSSVTAPEAFGGHKLASGGGMKYYRWYITVYNEDGLKKESSSYDYELQDGDKLIFHYVFDYRYETKYGNYSSYIPEVVQKYLNVADQNKDELAAVNNVVALINAIGRVTPDSGTAITAAREAYNALAEELKESVTNYETLTAAEKAYEDINNSTDERTPLTAPTIGAGETTGLYSVALTASGNTDIDGDAYTVVYSISLDGTNWGAWQASNVFEKLLPAKTYYFRAMAQTNDWTKYSDSEVSASIQISTLGGDAQATKVTNADELKLALAAATTDGELTVVDITNDIVINDITGDYWRVDLPAGSNVLLTSSNGSRFFFNEPGQGSYIGVTNGTTVTVRNLEIASISGSSLLISSNERQNALRFTDSNGVINLDGVTMYSENGYGIIGDYGTTSYPGTVNIYSGALNAIQDAKLMNLQSTSSVVNIIPTGNIMVEGTLQNVTKVNVLPLFGGDLTAAATGDLSSYTKLEEVNGTINYGKGLRVYTDGTKEPTKLTAPVAAKAGADGADKADLTYTVEDNKITFTLKKRKAGEVASVFQMQRNDLDDDMHARTSDADGIGATYEFSGLTKDTEYTFTLRYNSLDSKYIDAESTVEITTTFNPVQLTAPTLGVQVTKTASSITLTAPAASAEDSAATIQYRVSADNSTWGDWQSSNVFEGLTPGTTYYFQTRYKAVHKYWRDSDASASIFVATSAARLTAPSLSAEGAVATDDSVTLTAPAASSEDTNATIEYCVSADNSTWGDWQSSNVFTELEDNTTYYFQARYVSSDNTRYLDSDASAAVTVKTQLAANAPVFVVSSVTGRAGSTVDVTVEVKNNPGIISAKLSVAYDAEKLELTGVTDGRLLPAAAFSQTYTANPYIMNWIDSTATENYTSNGVLATLTFKVKDGLAAGITANVSISYEADDVYNAGLDNVTFDVVNGVVTVDDHNWDAVTYTWADDHSTCTAERSCTDEGCTEKETETVNASVDRTPASCTVAGKNVYTAEFANAAFQKQTYTENLNKLPHTWVKISGGDNAAIVKTCQCRHTENDTVGASTPVISVADVTASSKSEIKLAVSVANNPGFKAMTLTLAYDSSKLRLIGAENKTTLSAFSREGNVITIGGSAETANASANGTILVLSFEALADCENVTVSASYKPEDIYNATDEQVVFAVDNGKVNAAEYTLGDVNDDGEVDLKDVTVLRRHLAEWTGYKTIKKYAGDVNVDGVVDEKDAAFLLRHVAEYEGYETLG